MQIEQRVVAQSLFVRENGSVALRELLPPTPGNAPTTRREARARRRRHGGPLLAGFVVVAAAATGSAAALLGRSHDSSPAAYPTVARQPATSRFAATGAPAGSGGVVLGRTPSLSPSPTPSPSLSATTPQAIAEVPDRPQQDTFWPVFTYTLKAAEGASEPPGFPGVVEGFGKVRTARTTITLSRSRYFTAVGGLPVRTASYDVCRRQRFYVRWLAVDPRAVVDATLVDEHVRMVQNRPVRGAAGWMSSYGCVQPALRINPSVSGVPATATVIVETEVWQR
jgi:hypothetical protein